MTVKEKVLVSISVALLAIISQFSIPIPFSSVPLTFQLPIITILSIVLSPKLSTMSIFLYILLGCLGLPVFSNFKGGLNVILGPTGGYIIGFIIFSYIISASSKSNNLKTTYLFSFIGLFTDYIIGTIQLKLSLALTFYEACLVGVIPFILKDILLICISISLGFVIRKALKKNLLII